MTFVRGVNLPWLSYGNDFGANAWHRAGGLAQPEPHRRLIDLFARLARTDVHIVRWFLLCDGRAGLVEALDGSLAGLDAAVLGDFEVAVRTAEEYGIRLLPVLVDFHWCRPRHDHAAVACGGRARHLADSGDRARLLDRVIRPLLVRFAARDGIAAWDVINEPEWVTFSWRSWRPRRSVLPDAMRDYIAEAARLVHECTRHPATVGLASTDALPCVRGLGLDLYQTHWYDQHDDRAPLELSVAGFATDAPVILGEFPSRGSRRPIAGIEAAARAAGYAGALAWSLCGGDEASDPEAIWSWLET